MGVAKVACRTQLGLHAPLVQVEVSLASGLPAFCIVGLPATVIKESKERVRAALTNSGFSFPAGRITVSLAPAELPKEGGRFDLPIALGILLASGQLRAAETCGPREFYGELGLTGELKPVRGLLLAAVHARRHARELIVPRGNAAEASAAAPAQVRAASHLLEVCAHVSGAKRLRGHPRVSRKAARGVDEISRLDLADVLGQWHAKRALLIAAAGEHSLLMIGPPGSGKTMLAQRLPGLLPPLAESEALEVAAIAAASGAGFTPGHYGQRPFRAPHHTSSTAALVGGGARARPGEVSLAHHGVLFLDELPEFARAVLEALREPLESGSVAVSRAALHNCYPAQFQLLAAMNPCPCGRNGDAAAECRCTPAQIRAYCGRISAPLLDRLDMQVEVPRLSPRDFAATASEPRETTAAAAARVARVRGLQLARQGIANARLGDAEVQRVCATDELGQRVLADAMERFSLSGRARQRVLRVARTVADLATAPSITSVHISEALMLRGLDRQLTTAPSAPCDRRLA
ncbi:MAG TPA: YifB family Mg chelatase-like AAA ATPase [Steroidobacteraceae bacterium]|jgi:magnesium chelatase family protein|nr:YifB family Mg chelatase-like AAA ATPase [Steroidobacteraceae bacterium]